jgi:prepilin-type N-terminal cleavage/methylation domain-containing protein
MRPTPNPSRRALTLAKKTASRAFTLAELLVVMAIIAVVIALVVPALSGGRNAARKAATDKQIKEIANASAVFARDNNGRMPGYFTPREMGNQENITRGMSQSENVMLELMGFSTGGTTQVAVGPTSTNTLSLDPTMLGVPGTNGKQYYVPDKKYFVAQYSDTFQQIGSSPHTAIEGQVQLPDVIDAFGQPILIWVEDDTYITKPNTSTGQYRFGAVNSSTPAKHYWATNACFLTATSLGKKGMDQTSMSSGSMLGVNGPLSAQSLEGALGNPNAAWRPPNNLNDLPNFRALTSRSPFIVQSAGVDGTYFGRKDKGAKQFGAGFIDYRVNFAPNVTLPISATNQYTDKNGKPTNIDVLHDFDDVFGFGGN